MGPPGKCWIRIRNILERNCTIVLALPKYVKAICGKTTDKKNLKWIVGLFKHGLMHYRYKLPCFMSSEKNRLQNCLAVSNYSSGFLYVSSLPLKPFMLYSFTTFQCLSSIVSIPTIFNSRECLCNNLIHLLLIESSLLIPIVFCILLLNYRMCNVSISKKALPTCPLSHTKFFICRTICFGVSFDSYGLMTLFNIV